MSAEEAVELAFDELIALIDSDASEKDVHDRLVQLGDPLSKEDYGLLAGRVQVYQLVKRQAEEAPKAFTPDLTITIRGIDEPIFVKSRQGALDFSETDIEALTDAKDISRRMRDDIQKLYKDKTNDVESTRDWFDALSLRMTKMLPERLKQWLQHEKVKTIKLDLDVSVDFPIELCWMDGEHGGKMLCEKAEISRWYRNSAATYEEANRKVVHIGFVEGKLVDGFAGEEAAVLAGGKRSEGSLNAKTQEDVRQKIFQSGDIDLMHFKGHIINQGAGTEPGLSMSAGKPLPLAYINVAVAKRQVFFARNPLVVLNGCDGAVPTPLIGGEQNFPYSFIEGKAAGIVSTLWQVGEDPAGDFTRYFYAALRSGKRVSQAVKLAREELRKRAEEFAAAGDGSKFKVYYLGMHAYVYYGPPDLTVSFQN